MPGSVIGCVADIVAVDVPVAGPAEIVRIDLVRSVDADRIWTDQEAVRVKLRAGLIAVVMEA